MTSIKVFVAPRYYVGFIQNGNTLSRMNVVPPMIKKINY